MGGQEVRDVIESPVEGQDCLGVAKTHTVHVQSRRLWPTAVSVAVSLSGAGLASHPAGWIHAGTAGGPTGIT